MAKKKWVLVVLGFDGELVGAWDWTCAADLDNYCPLRGAGVSRQSWIMRIRSVIRHGEKITSLVPGWSWLSPMDGDGEEASGVLVLVPEDEIHLWEIEE
jgi:hypothetical protein